jgi:Cupin domain
VTETIRIGPIVFVAPDGRMPAPHYHRDWDEAVYGLRGTLTFTIDGQPAPLGPSDTLFVPHGIVHGFENRSGALATCLGVLTPGVLGPEYFREVAAAASSGKPDPAVLREIMLRHGLVPVNRQSAQTEFSWADFKPRNYGPLRLTFRAGPSTCTPVAAMRRTSALAA